MPKQLGRARSTGKTHLISVINVEHLISVMLSMSQKISRSVVQHQDLMWRPLGYKACVHTDL